ncbi:MAG: hydroxymethylbilane synthase [Verrucomicrobia bacterium]|nr:MAG: hydroxymethylbilane synthase [Verrucomicrobiota bacterium]PYJ31517.1 MAG: hydroxymethylbilane synthase [Verrucomicrobiota bacterium]
MSAGSRKIVLGTRGSELARTQTRLVEEAIRDAQPDVTIETKIVATRGDKVRVVDPRAGRKGLFTAEIERALIARDVDIAVHSAKDLPSETGLGAEIVAALPRAPTDDVLVSKHPGGLSSLPPGGAVATGSVRRRHQLLWKRADLDIIDVRGNVPTRLRKLAENEWDAVVLARAGLERLGLLDARTEINFEGQRFFLEILPCEIFLPAGGQGIVVLQVRSDDQSTKTIVDLINDRGTLLCLQAEREFLRRLQGDCNCPVGVLANIEDGKMKMRAQVFLQGAVAPHQGEVEGKPDERERLAAELLDRLRAPASAQSYGLAGEHE